MKTTEQNPPAAGEAAHRFNKFRIVPFAGGVSGLWHDPELMGGYLLAYFNKDHVNAKKAQSVADQLNSHAALVAALVAARQALEVARVSLKTAHHCMNSAEYSADETKFQNARDLVYTAFIGVSATQDRTAAALKLTA